MGYHILILPLAAGFVAQVIKFFIKSNKQKVKLRNMVAYSGMPSGHSAITISLVTIVGLEAGLASPFFAISVILALIVIRDALGIRKYLGQHGRVLNILVKDLEDDKLVDEQYPHLLENIGHTPMQVLAGSILGFTVSYIGFLLF
ncbi:MAG: divergent PAP2 family protein [Patescibacteria group bacterium]|jgi:acid phosphatase family membrane protein YuiD|nr:divergent PAP2 family protein [Patescibacteria group bacterium]